MTHKTIKVDYLARVEGEGGLKVVVRDGVVQSAELSIFEPPRFFEALLRGRAFSEAPDITARICGICPVAYQMSAVQAMENALGVTVSGPVRELRRLLYCGEWIESHTLHIYYAACARLSRLRGRHRHGARPCRRGAPRPRPQEGRQRDHDAARRARDPSDQRARRRVLPDAAPPRARAARRAVEMGARGGARNGALDRRLRLPRPRARLCLRRPAARARNIPSTKAASFRTAGSISRSPDYDEHFEETQVERSTALHAHFRGGGSYLVGPLARYSLNFDRLSPLAQEAAREAGLGRTCTNPYRSIVVRAVEVLYACDEALRIIAAYEEPEEPPSVAIAPRAGIGFGATEAPRGLLYHRYRLDADGTIAEARIVPPTSQNQASIEEDLTSFVGGFLDLPDDDLRHRCEQTVRNYDPCISCAAHFLKLEMDRG